jgi:hypothetical protein
MEKFGMNHQCSDPASNSATGVEILYSHLVLPPRGTSPLWAHAQ